MQLHDLSVKHVDGYNNAFERQKRLQWLAEEQQSQNSCNVLSNVRCLAEGVDVPALDAILFMHPRKSQIDVVQAVGQVMRRAENKQLGYVVLPVVVPSGQKPREYLDNNETFRVVWQVLNAIRSHHEGFEAELNLIRDGGESNRLSIIAIADWHERASSTGNGHGGSRTESKGQTKVLFPEELTSAIRAKIVEKCGSMLYWQDWSVKVAKIANTHIERIQATIDNSDRARKVFDAFLKELKDDLNRGITEQDAVEVLGQHMVTGPVFDALFGEARFAKQNPVSRGMQRVFHEMKDAHIRKEAESLEPFYADVRRRAAEANTPHARQTIIKQLYKSFFERAFPKTHKRLGIVYTPVAVVDFILHSVEEILKGEFDASMSSPGVEILDPFTGTGTFITRIIQTGIIAPEDLPVKYANHLHANEIVLLAYYVAAANIEAAYHEAINAKEYAPFSGIVLTDTFEVQDTEDSLPLFLPENSEQRKRQEAAAIQVIVSNPPWRTSQKSETEAAPNQKYPILRSRVRKRYVENSLYDSANRNYDLYILALRWATDRIGDSGIIGFVTNSGWLRNLTADGMRKSFQEEFTSVYVVDLRGVIPGDVNDGENIFDVKVGVCIVILVKNPARSGCRIRYFSIGDNLKKEAKLDVLRTLGSIRKLEFVQRMG